MHFGHPIFVGVLDADHKHLYLLKHVLGIVPDIELTDSWSACQHVFGEIKLSMNILVMDIILPDMDAVTFIIRMKDVYPDLHIIIYTYCEDMDLIKGVLCAGASGYILKKNGPLHLCHAIREVMQGGAPISRSVLDKIIEMLQGGYEQPVHPVFGVDELYRKIPVKVSFIDAPLTKREMDVLELLSSGKIYKEIAHELSISIATVKKHVISIYRKLQVSNKMEALNKWHHKMTFDV